MDELEVLRALLSAAKFALADQKPDEASALWKEAYDAMKDAVAAAPAGHEKAFKEAKQTVEYDTRRLDSDEERIEFAADFWRGFSDVLSDGTIDLDAPDAYKEGCKAARL